MATYKQIQDYVRKHHGYASETSWMAHVRDLAGVSVRSTHNRQGNLRAKPCLPEKRKDIQRVFEYFGMA
jgi:hypothetical protein